MTLKGVCPFAVWEPLVRHSGYVSTNGPFKDRPRGIVMHINDANSLDLHSFFMGLQSPHRVSCHFQILKSGKLYQYLPTTHSSWCQSAGNDEWLSCESEGLGADKAPNGKAEPFTHAQMVTWIRLANWLHHEPTVKLEYEVTDNTNGHGIIAHGDGGNSWGGHPNCPGTARKTQRTAIVTGAKLLDRAHTPPKPKPKPPAKPPAPKPPAPKPAGKTYTPTQVMHAFYCPNDHPHRLDTHLSVASGKTTWADVHKREGLS